MNKTVGPTRSKRGALSLMREGLPAYLVSKLARSSTLHAVQSA